MHINWSTHFRGLLTKMDYLLFSPSVTCSKTTDKRGATMPTIPVYYCKRCGTQFVCYGSERKPLARQDQTKDVFRILNHAPFIQEQLPVDQFTPHTPCEITSGNRKFSGLGIGELVGFIDEKELT